MRNEENLITEWDKLYIRNLSTFNKLKKFLKTNHKIVKQFHKKTTITHVLPYNTASEKLYSLFLNSLNAAGGNNLNKSAEATDIFIQIINKFKGKSRIDFNMFLNSFEGCKNSYDLFCHLKEYPNFRYKKTALFFVQLSIVQSTKYAIFKNITSKEFHKAIPLDIVIMDAVSVMLGLPYKKKLSYSHSEIFNKWSINKWGKDFFLFEDIWFWGYFGSFVKRKRFRKFEFNRSKLITNPWVYPPTLEPITPKIKQFCKIINKK